MRFPQPFVDEAWAANRAWGFLQNGRAYGTLDSDFMQVFPGYWTYFPFLPVLMQALPLWLVRPPQLMPLRLLSFFCGLVLLGSMYVIAFRLLGQRYAVMTVFLVAFSWPFSISAHLARADIIAAALGYGALALYLTPTIPRFWHGLIAGCLVGLAFECHPNALIFGPALVGICCGSEPLLAWKRGDFWGVVSGGFLGGLIYLALHVLPYPRTYTTLTNIFFSSTHTPPLLAGDLNLIMRSFVRLGRFLLGFSPLLIVAAISGVNLIRTGSQRARRALVLAITLICVGALWIRNRAFYYAILITPAIELLAAPMIVDEFNRQWRGRLVDYARKVLVLGITIGSILRVLGASQINYYPDYLATQSRLTRLALPGERIMGSQTYWFGLHQHDYDSWEELVYFQRYRPEASLEETLAFYRPDLFILDWQLEGYLRDEVRGPSYTGHLSLPRADLLALLEGKGELIASFNGGYYGPIRVYRLRWP
jgi:hypothetical protein